MGSARKNNKKKVILFIKLNFGYNKKTPLKAFDNHDNF
jgi:hypothetical protein